MVKYANDPKNRDLEIIKVCEVCKEEYHPRKKALAAMSRFCSPECTRKGMRGVMQESYGKNTDPKFKKNK